jgi:hypothetical protein
MAGDADDMDDGSEVNSYLYIPVSSNNLFV